MILLLINILSSDPCLWSLHQIMLVFTVKAHVIGWRCVTLKKHSLRLNSSQSGTIYHNCSVSKSTLKYYISMTSLWSDKTTHLKSWASHWLDINMLFQIQKQSAQKAIDKSMQLVIKVRPIDVMQYGNSLVTWSCQYLQHKSL